MRLSRPIRIFRLLILILPLLVSGCAANKKIVLYPIRDTDIRVTETEVIMSKWYFEHVLKVELEQGR